MKYIIDTDPGIDDATAIMMAYLNNLDIIGFTLATGNIELKKSEKNLKIIEDFLGSNIRIYKGSKQNEVRGEKAQFAHGVEGLGYNVYPETKRVTEKKYAEDFIIKASKRYKNNLTIICLGSLTNLATALRKDKNLENRLSRVIVMGVSYDKEAEEPYHEFNISVDPASAAKVFSSKIKEIKVVTHEMGIKTWIEKEYIESLIKSKKITSRFLSSIAKKYMEFSYEHYGVVGMTVPDPVAVSYAINNKILSFTPCKIKVDREDKGICTIEELEESNIEISTDVDIEMFKKLFKRTFN